MHFRFIVLLIRREVFCSTANNNCVCWVISLVLRLRAPETRKTRNRTPGGNPLSPKNIPCETSRRLGAMHLRNVLVVKSNGGHSWCKTLGHQNSASYISTQQHFCWVLSSQEMHRWSSAGTPHLEMLVKASQRCCWNLIEKRMRLRNRASPVH